jgi:antitoxin (DNA-binding transcriptional repressor) of toxin-antitoxin stability system
MDNTPRELQGAPPIVTTSELSRSPGEVLDRIARGERLIVCRRNRPIATLQPLDGFVMQPFTGAARDIFGWPVGSAAQELAKLTHAQRLLMVEGYRNGRLSTSVPGHCFAAGEAAHAIEDLKLRGMARRVTNRGTELTARGLAMRELLLKELGRLGPEDSLLGYPKPDLPGWR